MKEIIQLQKSRNGFFGKTSDGPDKAFMELSAEKGWPSLQSQDQKQVQQSSLHEAKKSHVAQHDIAKRLSAMHADVDSVDYVRLNKTLGGDKKDLKAHQKGAAQERKRLELLTDSEDEDAEVNRNENRQHEMLLMKRLKHLRDSEHDKDEHKGEGAEADENLEHQRKALFGCHDLLYMEDWWIDRNARVDLLSKALHETYPLSQSERISILRALLEAEDSESERTWILRALLDAEGAKYGQDNPVDPELLERLNNLQEPDELELLKAQAKELCVSHKAQNKQVSHQMDAEWRKYGQDNAVDPKFLERLNSLREAGEWESLKTEEKSVAVPNQAQHFQESYQDNYSHSESDKQPPLQLNSDSENDEELHFSLDEESNSETEL